MQSHFVVMFPGSLFDMYLKERAEIRLSLAANVKNKICVSCLPNGQAHQATLPQKVYRSLLLEAYVHILYFLSDAFI